ncbi:hypothetical protein CsSME_00006907 [Camellia sinensis var. sinensis]
MARILYPLEQKDGILIHQPLSPFSSFSFSQSSSDFEKQSTASRPSAGIINPAILLAIVILALIFFIYGLLHLLVRFLMKTRPFSSISQSNRYPEASGSHTLQRQLQQLFRLHDSGLDQTLIDGLPVFFYEDIIGLKEPFDCAVCLCEFSDQDRLRLLPICSHAFHINCIDTWLLSNSTCPLCRGTLVSSCLPMESPFLNLDSSREREQLSGFLGDAKNDFSCGARRENVGGKRVLPVRLGKFRSLNLGGENEEPCQGESSGCKLDERRCYSMGSLQYVVGDSNLQVALSLVSGDGGGGGNSARSGDVEGQKITSRARGESFSVSKIWLWSKKAKYPNSSETSLGA